MAHFNEEELRILAMSAPVWLRMLQEKERRILDKIYGNFRNGSKDFVSDLAEYSVIRELAREITSALKANDTN